MSVHVPANDVGAPRAQAGPNPQHLLATLLGEYLDSSDADLPSMAVVAMLREFGISESSARAALSRLTKRGLIAVRRPGRAPVYHLTPQAIARHHSRMHHFLSFGAHPPQWTGDWLVVSFSLPEPKQAQRHHIRKTLSALRFVRLYDSVWICPGRDARPVTQALREILDGAEDARWSVMHARFDDEAGPNGPAVAYDLAGLAAGYRSFLDRYADLLSAVRARDVDASRALVARTSIMDSWRVFADLDPDLPEHLLPTPWPRRAARELFLEIHSALGPLAEARLVEVATPYWPAAASWLTHFQAPVDPSPADPSPADPSPADPSPADPSPVDPGQVDPAPVDPLPVDSPPVDAAPVDTARADAARDDAASSTFLRPTGGDEAHRIHL